MEIQFKKHVRVVCDLQPKMVCWVKGWGKGIPETTQFVITNIEYKPSCESGFMVTIDDYKGNIHTLDSGWITTKIK